MNLVSFNRYFKKQCSVVTLLFCLISTATLADTTARFDQPRIFENEAVRLIIETNDKTATSQPNLSALETNFNIIGSSSGQNISIVNGQQTVQRQWVFELEPLQSGVITIPALQVGQEQTSPTTLTVLPAAKGSTGGVQDIFIETEILQSNPYVQQQVDFVVKLYLAVDLLDGSLTEPAHPDIIVQRIGADTTDEKIIGGKRYRVVQRRYSIFPQKSGDLTIPPIRFSGIAQKTSQDNRRFMDTLFNQGTRIRSRSNAVTLAVRPPNPAFTGITWLPARKLQVDDLSQDVGTLELGEPLNRQIQLQALGLVANQLPDIVIPEDDNYKAYNDKVESNTQVTADGPLAIKQQSIAIIPTESGTIQLPAYQINWWDVEQDIQRQAEIPAREILVLPSSNPPATPTIISASNAQQTDNIEPRTADEQPSGSQWKTISFFLAGLWGLTLVFTGYLWQQRRAVTSLIANKEKAKVPTTLSQILATLKRACNQNDAQAARRSIIQWAKLTFTSKLVTDFSDIERYLNSPELATQLQQLDNVLYAPGDATWNGKHFWQVFQSVAVRMQPTSASPDPLSSLYPEHTLKA